MVSVNRNISLKVRNSKKIFIYSKLEYSSVGGRLILEYKLQNITLFGQLLDIETAKYVTHCKTK